MSNVENERRNICDNILHANIMNRIVLPNVIVVDETS